MIKAIYKYIMEYKKKPEIIKDHELLDLIIAVNEHFKCDIRVNSRKRKIVMSRGVYFWLARNTTLYSLETIGKYVYRDHSSVTYALQNFNSWITHDKVFSAKFESLKKMILLNDSFSLLSYDQLLYEHRMLQIENDELKKQLLK